MSAAADFEKPALELAVGRRVLVLLTVIIASSAYNAATFTACKNRRFCRIALLCEAYSNSVWGGHLGKAKHGVNGIGSGQVRKHRK